MKKILAILLAMMLVMVSVAALASAPEYADVPLHEHLDNPEPTEEQTITIKKVYTITLPDAVLDDPTLLAKYSLTADAISFDVTGTVQAGSSSVTEAPEVSIADLTIDETTIVAADIETDAETGAKTVTKEFPLEITIPVYSEVGIYEYTITENGNHTGVGYHETNGESKPFYLRVTVTRETVIDPETKEPVMENGKPKTALNISGIALRETSATDTTTTTKIDTFGNTYDTGRLAVTKDVSGNLGDRGQDFEVKVTFESEKPVGATIKYSDNEKTAQTGSLTLTKADGEDKYTAVANLLIHHGEVVQFENIPAGVTYTVKEITDDGSAWKTHSYDNPTYDNPTKTIVAKEDITATVKNTKSLPNPDTGITLETLPYVLMMALAMMGLVALKLRKREEY